MSSRTNNYNAYTADVTSGLAPGIMTMTVDSVPPTLVGPIYFVIDPDDPTKREWLRVDSINGLTMTIGERGLTGSVGDDHDVGAKLESMTTMQILEDIFDDIEAEEANLATHEANPNDPHQPAGYMKQSDANDLYVAKAGSSMTGPLTLNADPTGNLNAATKQYVDDGPFLNRVLGGTMEDDLILDRTPNPADPDLIAATKAYVDGAISGDPAGLPAGTRLVFDQDSAPFGWTRDTSIDDRMIRIVSGTRSDGGTWDFPTHTHTNPGGAASSGNHSHTVGSHTHAVPNHTHTNPNTGASLAGGTAIGLEGTQTQFEYNTKSHSHNQGITGPVAQTTNSGGPNGTADNGSHVHTVGATAANAALNSWRPSYRSMIIAVKDSV